jgi:hypothetical protein
MSDAIPECACHLVPTLARLLGPNSPVVRSAKLCTTTNVKAIDEWGWQGHLALEELLLFPRLPADVRARLKADHDKWRRLRRHGLMPDASEYAAHAELEKAWFATIT